MKTIRLIVLAALLLPALVSQAQTKEETIAWLKEKLGKALRRNPHLESYESVRNIQLVSIDECQLVFSYEYKAGRSPLDLWEIYNASMPTEDFKISRNYPSEGQMNRTKTREYYFGDPIIIGYEEVNLYERIEKAMAHLATFCPKKTEAF